jgi:DinB superfamily
MTTANIHASLSFPVGKFQAPATFSATTRRTAIETLRHLPSALVEATAGLTQKQLDEPYREGGWSLRQVVHHVADSHINAYSRVRLALTEDWPTIKPYGQDPWANLTDARTLPIDVSLTLLDALHTRWVALFESLTEADWQRGYLHPESGRQTIDQVLELYAWHSRHHTAHITGLRHSKGW